MTTGKKDLFFEKRFISVFRVRHSTSLPTPQHTDMLGALCAVSPCALSMSLVRFLIRTVAQPRTDVQPARGLRTPAANRACAASLISPPGRSATTSARDPAVLVWRVQEALFTKYISDFHALRVVHEALCPPHYVLARRLTSACEVAMSSASAARITPRSGRCPV